MQEDKEAHLKSLHQKYKTMTPQVRIIKAKELRAARRDARRVKREAVQGLKRAVHQRKDGLIVPDESVEPT